MIDQTFPRRKCTPDPRIAELEAIAAEERIRLPLPIPLILWFEDRGYVVDFATGLATRPADATPTASATAILHLTQHEVGDL